MLRAAAALGPSLPGALTGPRSPLKHAQIYNHAALGVPLTHSPSGSGSCASTAFGAAINNGSGGSSTVVLRAQVAQQPPRVSLQPERQPASVMSLLGGSGSGAQAAAAQQQQWQQQQPAAAAAAGAAAAAAAARPLRARQLFPACGAAELDAWLSGAERLCAKVGAHSD